MHCDIELTRIAIFQFEFKKNTNPKIDLKNIVIDRVSTYSTNIIIYLTCIMLYNEVINLFMRILTFYNMEFSHLKEYFKIF